jgi:hypothetical protein
MPPRIPSSSPITLAVREPSTTLTLLLPCTLQAWHPSHQTTPITPKTAIRCLSTTRPSQRAESGIRRRFRKWLGTDGQKFMRPRGYNNFVGRHRNPEEDHVAQPFPLNQNFRAQSVLGEPTRELIWQRVMQQGDSLKGVSAELGIDLRRVAAVVRLKEVEKGWVASVCRLFLLLAVAFFLPSSIFSCSPM